MVASRVARVRTGEGSRLPAGPADLPAPASRRSRAADRLPNARPTLCGRARPRRARVARATQRDRAGSDRGDARGRSDRGTVPLLESRAAVAPAPRSRSRSGTDSPRPHAPSLRDRDTYAYAVRGADGEGAIRYHDANDL